ncbi:RidA family protein [Limobrevibacterium gyesilva]|uniref:RidA family protein n=1 Tax=Limobrevibacterium gyesilva TaxID=2991712 RepID=A0AA41YM49_9PROT|nr:RidA family protein [Limobrevibacterium gyesilva]MCW3474493.1 RidA family protein [Limobrevibacterium gyesilva]
MQRRDINAPDAPAPASPYTQAVEITGATRTLYVSGQIPADRNGTVPDDITAQCRLAWANVEAQLRAAGMSLDNIVKVTTIMPDHANLGASRAVRAEVLGDRRPGSTLIVGGLANPAWKIEIEVIACV